MSFSFSTSVKYVLSVFLTALLTAGSIYAVNITTLTQVAGPSDTITSTWVNAVNTASVSASTFSNLECSNSYNGSMGWIIACVNKQTGNSEPGTCTVSLSSSIGTSASRTAATLAMMGNCNL